MQKTCEELENAASDAFWAEDWVGVENNMTELEQRFPDKAATLRSEFEDIIFETVYISPEDSYDNA